MEGTPVRSALSPLAVDLPVGAYIVVEHRGNNVPAQVTAITHGNGHVHATIRLLMAGSTAKLSWPGNAEVWRLPEHFGVCWRCQTISPCPHETNERVQALKDAENDPFLDIVRTYNNTTA